MLLQAGSADMRGPVTFLVVVVAARADNHGLMVQNLRGKYEHNLDHNYKYGTCGRPEWVAVSATGADPPHGSVVGGRDLNIKTVREMIFIPTKVFDF